MISVLQSCHSPQLELLSGSFIVEWYCRCTPFYISWWKFSNHKRFLASCTSKFEINGTRNFNLTVYWHWNIKQQYCRVSNNPQTLDFVKSVSYNSSFFDSKTENCLFVERWCHQQKLKNMYVHITRSDVSTYLSVPFLNCNHQGSGWWIVLQKLWVSQNSLWISYAL